MCEVQPTKISFMEYIIRKYEHYQYDGPPLGFGANGSSPARARPDTGSGAYILGKSHVFDIKFHVIEANK